MGVGGCELKTIGYTCRSVVLTVFGPGFNSRRLHHTTLVERELVPRSLLAHGAPRSCHGVPTVTLALSASISVP